MKQNPKLNRILLYIKCNFVVFESRPVNYREIVMLVDALLRATISERQVEVIDGPKRSLHHLIDI